MSRTYKIVAITIFICVVTSVYFKQIVYALYLSGVYPVKAQVKDVSIEFTDAWLPSYSTESSIWDSFNNDHSRHGALFYKIDWLNPFSNGTIAVIWVGDKYDNIDQASNIDKQTMHFDWGTAYVIKPKIIKDKSYVVAVVPKYHIMIDADNLEQLNEIKKFTKITSTVP
ncbi:MAG: hypothetical protein WAW02_11595 [Sideroxyarcus sp.]